MKLSLPLLEKKAEEFRSKYGLGITEPINLKDLLDNLGVVTIFLPLPNSDFSGMALKVNSQKEGGSEIRFILINSKHPKGKQNFTICHELYHLFVQEKFSYQICYTGKFSKQNDPEEFNADVFASFLLVPESGILNMIPDKELESIDKITLSTVLKIEQYYKSSRRALLYRLRKLNIISPEGYERFSEYIISNAKRLGYDASLYKGKENSKDVWGDYEKVAEFLYHNEAISESYFHSLLFDIGKEIEE